MTNLVNNLLILPEKTCTMNSDFWDTRYSEDNFIYGKEPNTQFKSFIDRFSIPGKIFLPAEGEGRNGVYAALKGWEVTATDISKQAREKALRLASENGVSLLYHHSDILSLDLKNEYFDVIALVFLHLVPSRRFQVFLKLLNSLKTGGTFFLVGFHNDQVNYKSGGPTKQELLYTPAQLKNELSGLEVLQVEEFEHILTEGKYQNGLARLVLLEGVKI